MKTSLLLLLSAVLSTPAAAFRYSMFAGRPPGGPANVVNPKGGPPPPPPTLQNHAASPLKAGPGPGQQQINPNAGPPPFPPKSAPPPSPPAAVIKKQPPNKHAQNESPKPTAKPPNPDKGRKCQQNIPPQLMIPVGGDRLVYLSWRDERYNGGDRAETWNAARSFCRRRCLDLVSVDSGELNRLLVDAARRDGVMGLWTSGRYCPTGNCTSNSQNLLSHWKWSNDEKGYSPIEDHWSHSGGLGRRQPDNLLETTGTGDREECLAMLNDWYDDGVSWHDLMCGDRLAFACQGFTDLDVAGSNKYEENTRNEFADRDVQSGDARQPRSTPPPVVGAPEGGQQQQLLPVPQQQQQQGSPIPPQQPFPGRYGPPLPFGGPGPAGVRGPPPSPFRRPNAFPQPWRRY